MLSRHHTLLRVEHHARGRRVWLLDRRLHHGRFGVWLACCGIGLMLHDILDFPWRTR